VKLWRSALPTIQPHYAVKANNDSRLLKWLAAEGVKFDCASPNEIRQALKVGAQPSDIIYANPCKSIQDIQAAVQLGIPTTVVDSPEEVQKLLEAGFGAEGRPANTLIRLKVSDSGSAQPFSRKFGMPIAWIPEVLELMRGTGLHHVGWSFHVGSLCNQPQQFAAAVELCAEADAIARAPARIIDVGGGFHSDPEQFGAAAAELRRAQRWFPEAHWIAEPGRFFAAPIVTLRVPVIGVKARSDRSGWIYTVAESVYGSFSNIPFDGQVPTYRLLASDAASRPKARATIFGRTCDSADCLAEDIELPELRVGDLLEVPNMGAYTTVSATTFNGFPKTKRLYGRV